MKLLLWLIVAIVVLVLVFLGLSAYGAKKWSEVSEKLTQSLEAGRLEPSKQPLLKMRYDAKELEGLPAPVQKYFRTVLKDGQTIVSSTTLSMSGNINMSTSSEQWKPFTSVQHVVTRRPGFIWDARIEMFPSIEVRVIDSYVTGNGLLHAAVLGLFTVANVSGGGEIAKAEFMRYFAEAVWYPTALLPSQGVKWQAVDSTSANATIVDGPLTITLLFRFNESGLIDSFRAEARNATGVGDEPISLPWEGRFSNYQDHDGMKIPFAGEVAYIRPSGRKTYFRGQVSSLNYTYHP